MSTHALHRRCAGHDPATPPADPRCTRVDTTLYLVQVGGEKTPVALCPRHAAELRVDEFRSAA